MPNKYIMPEPDPAPGRDSVHDKLRRQYGDEFPEVIDDLWDKALQAQEKYGLEKPGLYSHNGRDALKDAYQEILDLVAYIKQYQMEVGPNYFATRIHVLLSLASEMRNQLEKGE